MVEPVILGPHVLGKCPIHSKAKRTTFRTDIVRTGTAKGTDATCLCCRFAGHSITDNKALDPFTNLDNLSRPLVPQNYRRASEEGELTMIHVWLTATDTAILDLNQTLLRTDSGNWYIADINRLVSFIIEDNCFHRLFPILVVYLGFQP
jgi:hypothetical protein